MYLKSLILKGFKSFADTTKLDFEPGVTVVVGPNGSGKSNLVDAIAWVLGSQSPRSIRSTKMEDVIFAGSQKRSALGRSEVSLVLDNELLDNESGLTALDFPEIVISRTLFRTGESEYGINGAVCRLMDVSELLADSGLGQSQHTIVSQGEVETVLNDRSEDRRMIIEEAAGVLKHRKRRERAERRLSGTDSDLARLGDLFREVSRQLEPLERQAEAARQHGEMLEELNHLRIYTAGEELRGLKQEKEFLGQKHKSLKEAESDLLGRQLILRSAIKEEETKMKDFGMDTSGEVLASLESLKARTEGVLRNLRDRAMQLDAQAGLAGEAKEAKQQKQECETELASTQAKLSELTERLAEFDIKLEDTEVRAEDLLEIDAQLLAMEKAETEILSERSGLESKLAEHTRKAQEIGHLVFEKNKEFESKETEKMKWASKLEALAMTENFSSAPTRPENTSVVGDLIVADPGYERAAAAAFGESVNAIVAVDSQSASQIMEDIKESGGTGLLLPADQKSADRPATGQPLADTNHLPLISKVSIIEESLEPLLEILLGSMLVADTWKEALQLHLETGLDVVSCEGDKFSSAGWQLGDVNSKHGTALAKAARNAAEAEAKASLSELEGQLSGISTKLKELRNTEQEVLIAKKALEVQLEAGREKIRSAESKKTELQVQQGELKQRLQVKMDRRQVELKSLKEKENTLLLRQKELEIALSAHTQKLLMLEKQLGEISNDGFDKLEVITSLNAFFGTVQSTIESRLETLRESRRVQSEESRASANKLDRSRREKEEVDTKLAELKESVTQIEITHAEISARLENVVENLNRDLDCGAKEAMEAKAPELPAETTSKERIQEIEHKLRLIGPVNHLALKEYENIKSRHSFLAEQMDDIKSARKELRKLIRTIDVEMANAFESAFTDIAANFEVLFQTAFPGGEGKITLSNPENLLETGVEIEARPGDKKIKRLSLLSGGERSLVALTFLFSVIKSRPAPFCILDEVDAALDDINLCRFLDLVDVLASETQLLIVSHQKRTMEAADFLYGISMPTEGVTRVISEKRATSENRATLEPEKEAKPAKQLIS